MQVGVAGELHMTDVLQIRALSRKALLPTSCHSGHQTGVVFLKYIVFLVLLYK